MNTDKIFAEAIANEYSAKTSRKVVALIKFDMWVKFPAKLWAYIWGILFAVVAVAGALLAKIIANSVVPFIALVLVFVGIVGMGTTIPLYNKILSVRKSKYAIDVLVLANDIIDDYQ